MAGLSRPVGPSDTSHLGSYRMLAALRALWQGTGLWRGRYDPRAETHGDCGPHDRQRARMVRSFSVTAMAIPTFVIGILPGYATLGLFAPIALTLRPSARDQHIEHD